MDDLVPVLWTRLVMNSALPKEFGLILLFVMVNCIIATPVIRLFAKSLSLKHAFSLAIRAFVPTSFALAAYFIAKIYLDLPPRFDGLAATAAMSIAGIIITARAERDYGLVKDGLLGVGAKTALTLILLSWLFFAVSVAAHILI